MMVFCFAVSCVETWKVESERWQKEKPTMVTAVAVVKKTVTPLGEQPLIPLPKPPPTPLPPPNTLTHMIMIIKTQQIKHYQLKAQKLLNEMLENSIEIVRNPVPVVDEDSENNECGIRLFKHAQPGIVFDHVDEPQPPRKRPRILPGGDIDEKSKKFKKRIRSTAVNGIDIIAAANKAYKKSLARLEAKDAAAKAKAKREEERVENLKKIRGERWLPSMAKEMQVKMRH